MNRNHWGGGDGQDDKKRLSVERKESLTLNQCTMCQQGTKEGSQGHEGRKEGIKEVKEGREKKV